MRKTSDRLNFLDEQAAIARQLNVSKSTLVTQNYSSEIGTVATIETESPFYMRGYEAIEKEIELIKARNDKKPFIDGLFELDQKKRALEQDKAIERAQKLLAVTPVATGDGFSAVSMSVGATEFVVPNRFSLMLALSGLFGLMSASIYVLITHTLNKRKKETENSQSHHESQLYDVMSKS